LKTLCIAVALAVTAAGATVAPSVSAAPTPATGAITDPKLQAEIAEATGQAQRIEATGARTTAPTVSVEVLTTDVDSTKRLVRAYGGTVTGDVPGALVQAEVPPAAAGLIAGGRTVDSMRSPMRAGRLPVPQTIARQRTEAIAGTGPTVGDQVQRTGASSWHEVGFIGTGVKVGIVDYFDLRFWDTTEVGPVPDAAHQFCRDTTPANPFPLCLSANSINSLNGDIHGVAVAEIIKDMAPGAELFVASVGTVSDLRAAIDWFAMNGVTIMSRSLGSAYDGPGDGTGPLDSAVDYAVSKGVMWINSAGNDGFGAYVRRSVPATDAAGYVSFAASGSDTWLRVDSQPGGCFFLDGVRWANDWNLPAAQRTDYRLEVYEPAPGFVPGGIGTTRNPTSSQVRAFNLNADVNQGGQGTGRNIIDASQRVGARPLEATDLTICPNNAANAIDGSAVTYLRVKRNLATAIGTNPDVMEVAIAGNAFVEQWTSGGSAAKPVVDSKNVAAMAIGALASKPEMRDPANPAGIAYYSSRGPTNDGRIKPDIVSLAGMYSASYALYDAVMYPGQASDPHFEGTSAAAPAAAGAAAVLASGRVALPGAPMATVLRHLALDTGALGVDNTYGHGELNMSLPPSFAPTLRTGPTWFDPLPTPVRVHNTITGLGGRAGRRAPYSIVDVALDTAIPPGMSAVALNVTVVSPVRSGHVEVHPFGESPLGSISTLNVSAPGGVHPNFTIVPLGETRSLRVYMLTGGHLIVDVLGYFDGGQFATPEDVSVGRGRFQPLPEPERWVDQRTVTSQVDSDVTPPDTTAMRAALDADEVAALVVNLTTSGATRSGDLKAFTAGGEPGNFSNANFTVGGASTNTAIVRVDDLERFTMRTNNVAGNTVKVTVDVVGYFTAAAAPNSRDGLFVPVRAARVHREYPPQVSGDRAITFAGVSDTEVLAVSANLTITAPINAGSLTLWSGATPRPGTVNVSYSRGQTVANGAIFGTRWDSSADGGLGANAAVAFTNQAAILIIDVNGYFLKAAPPTP